MAHEEYIRIVPGANTAVLFIHGILGTPDHFKDLVPLVPEEWSVCNILLPGHGGGAGDFSRSSMDQWRSYVDDKAQMLLKDHDRLLIAAHSMGTLLAIEQAVKEPDRIAGLFLLAVPIRLRIRAQMLSNAWKVYWNRIDPADTMAVAARNACSITHDKRLWLYLGWILRYLELFQTIRSTRKLLPELNTAGAVFQSRKDEMVSLRALADLHPCGSLQVSVLDSSRHFYYHPEDLELLKKSLRSFIQ